MFYCLFYTVRPGFSRVKCNSRNRLMGLLVLLPIVSIALDAAKIGRITAVPIEAFPKMLISSFANVEVYIHLIITQYF